MEEGKAKSGEASGSFVKKKSSSGCLIIKKKVFDDLSKEKKRSRLDLSDSESSREFLEPLRRQVVPRSDQYGNGSVVYRQGVVDDGELGRNGETESERERNRLGVFEFDEYDALDRMNMRKSYVEDKKLKLNQRGFEGGSSRRHSHVVKNRFEMEDDEAHIPLSHLREKFREASDEPIRLQGKNGVLKVMVNKRKNLNSSLKTDDHQGGEDRTKDAIKKVKTSLYSASKQSENQASCVRREKKLKSEQKLGSSMSTKSDMAGVESDTEDSDMSLKLGSTSAQARSSAKGVKDKIKRDSSAEKITPIRDTEGKVKDGSGKKPILYVRREKSETKLGNSLSTKREMVREESETENSDASLKPGSTGVPSRSSGKGVKIKVERAASAKKITPIRADEGKVKRGSGTEKQLLREKIKNMLVNAGWTIDYRPRRNRDYLDAVYINPSGTAYWSIIKAHDAFQKDLNIKPSGESSPFTPLPEEILNKLTRQTRKKIEKEMKNKRRYDGSSKNGKQAVVSESEEGTDGDEHEEKLSSFTKQNGKSAKGSMQELNYLSGDNSSVNLCNRLTKSPTMLCI